MRHEILELRSIPNSRLLLHRAIIRILDSEEFEKAYFKASDLDKVNLFIIIYNSDKERLNLWIKKILKKRNICELHAEANRLNIKDFRRKSKDQLEFLIETAKGNNYAKA